MIYAVVAALVFGEAALFFGFVLPGETAIVVGGVLASQGRVSLPLLLLIVVVAAVVGDSVGYEIGRRYGSRLLETRAMRKYQGKVGKAQDLIRRRGPLAVFIGRFTALLRALMPALVGSSKMPYHRFLIFNMIGGIIWGTVFTLGGYYTGQAFEHTAKLVGRWAAVAVAIIAVVALAVWGIRKHRREASDEPLAAQEHSDERPITGQSLSETRTSEVAATTNDAL
ncbi:MAG: associated protein [Actinomycetia bacterium]|nr:associated protein [Actinomycetes bacterium]